jgi:hypothetical protein
VAKALAVPKKKRGFPSKKGRLLDNKRQLKLLLQAGWTDKEVGEFFGIARETLVTWRREDPEIKKMMDEWRVPSNEKIERTMYEKANGYTVREVQQRTDSKGNVSTVETIKELPPDTTAMIFWLKNRSASKWREKIELGGGDINVTVTRKEFKPST